MRDEIRELAQAWTDLRPWLVLFVYVGIAAVLLSLVDTLVGTISELLEWRRRRLLRKEAPVLFDYEAWLEERLEADARRRLRAVPEAVRLRERSEFVRNLTGDRLE